VPIQNVATLLENLVVAEAAIVLLDRLRPPQRLGFATAFAMPTISEWRPHSQAVGISTAALQAVAAGGGDSEFIDSMRACLRRFPGQGPNAALLVSLLATRRHVGVRVWANDIVDGHYGNAMPSLERVAERVTEILPEGNPFIDSVVCELPYPSSLPRLRASVDGWIDVGAVLGFLDPMRYVRGSCQPDETSSTDHRQWLAILRERDPVLVVHFTGNRDAASLSLELAELREDLGQCGFGSWTEVQRQSYVVSVGSRNSDILAELEGRVWGSWQAWCDAVAPEIVNRDLRIRRSSDTLECAG